MRSWRHAMLRSSWSCALMLLVAGTSAAGARDSKYTITQANNAAPKEVREPIRKLLADKSIELLNNGAITCQLWLRRDVPVKATPEQIKNGLTYREVDESTIFEGERFGQAWTD